MCEVLDRIESRGIEKGILTERERMICRMYKKGYTVEVISEIMEMPEKAVRIVVGEPVLV